MPPVITDFLVHGPALRAIRQKSYKSLRDVSRASGVDPSYLAKLERGVNSNATSEVIERVAAALDVPVEAVTIKRAVA